MYNDFVPLGRLACSSVRWALGDRGSFRVLLAEVRGISP